MRQHNNFSTFYFADVEFCVSFCCPFLRDSSYTVIVIFRAISADLNAFSTRHPLIYLALFVLALKFSL